MPSVKSEIGGHDGIGAPATRRLTGETISFRVTGCDMTFRVVTFGELMREQTYDQIKGRRTLRASQRVEVERHWKELDNALLLLRGQPDEATRNAGERLLGAALAIGYFHRGEPGVPREAEKQVGQKQTAGARKAVRATQVAKEGVLAKAIIWDLCFALWSREPEILERSEFVRETARCIRLSLLQSMKPHIAPGSLWEAPAENDTISDHNLFKRTRNHIGAAAKSFQRGFV